jgi:predicted N-acetyltransferase YhbS
MPIRQERLSDYNEVCNLVKISFATNEDDDGTTHEYLNELRKKDVFIPELSLVTEQAGFIIGQIVLYKTIISTPKGERTELLLSPMCVHPNVFRQGIARAMTEEALRIAGDLGFSAVFLCGSPKIYSRLGFVPTYRFNIYHIKDKTASWSMVRELYPDALKGIIGTVDIV